MTEIPERKIYFAASIRSGREYQPIYKVVIEHLKQYGRVLTEHIGASTLGIAGESDLADEQIFRRDVDWIRDADVLVADVSLPSLGVGYEIGRAESLHKHILCLYCAGTKKKLTPMVVGNPACRVFLYHNVEKALHMLDRFFATFDE